MVIPPSRLRFYRRINRLRAGNWGEHVPPDRVVQSVIYLWQKKSFEALTPTRPPYGCSGIIKDPAIKDFAAWLTTQPFNEAAYWLATSYALLVSEATRVDRALYFTPPALADRVIDQLLAHGASLTNGQWHDPACGGAAFLVPIANRMNEELSMQGVTPVDRLRHISKNISGSDLDPFLLKVSQSLIEMTLYPEILKTGFSPNFLLRLRDGLISNERDNERADVVAINPPYRKLKKDEAKNYKGIYEDVIEGQPNMYGLFISKSLNLAKAGGLVGLLTPTSFLSGRSFSKLRKKLSRQGSVAEIDMLSDRASMFIDVQQEAAITVLRKKELEASQSSNPKVNVLEADGTFTPLGAYQLSASGRLWSIPRSVEDAKWLRAARGSGARLNDYGYQAQIGNLVGYRDTRPRYTVPPVARVGFSETGPTVVPLVWATDITQDGFFSYQRQTRQARTEHFVEIKSLHDSGVVTSPSVVLQRLTSIDQRNRLIAAAIPKSFLDKYRGFVCENHVIILQPVEEDAASPEMLAALLNTKCVNSVFRCISGSSNVSVYELGELLLPDRGRLETYYEQYGVMEVAAMAAYAPGYGH